MRSFAYKVGQYLIYIMLAFGIVASAYGWVSNIVDLVQHWGTESTMLTVLRIIGIPFGVLGILLGWFC